MILAVSIVEPWRNLSLCWRSLGGSRPAKVVEPCPGRFAENFSLKTKLDNRRCVHFGSLPMNQHWRYRRGR